MRHVEKDAERENGIDQPPDQSETIQTNQARQEWFKIILLNLIVAASVSLARAAMDSLFNSSYGGNLRHDRNDYARDGYPF